MAEEETNQDSLKTGTDTHTSWSTESSKLKLGQIDNDDLTSLAAPSREHYI